MIGHTEVKIAPTQEKRAIELARLVQQRLWRIQIAAERRRALTENTGLLEGHGLPGITEVIRMIDADTGDQRHVGVHHVDRVQTTAQTDFQHHCIEPGALEQPECRQGAHFEVSQGRVAAPGLYRGKGLAQLGIRGFDAIDGYPLVVTQQVWGVVDPHFQALGPQQRRHERTGGTLAVGPGDRDHPRRRLAQPHTGRYLLRSLQAHVNG